MDPLCNLPGQASYELLQYHTVSVSLDIASLSQEPFAAGIPELLGHHEGSVAFAQIQGMESLAPVLKKA